MTLNSLCQLSPKFELAGHVFATGMLEFTSRDFWRVAFLQDHNTRVVVFGTGLLGAAAGIIGSFALLRRRALMGDALSHATLPGIAAAFLIASALGGSGKSLPILLTGAAISGALGTAAILAIRNFTKLKEDAALGIVLSVFFGAGVALLGIVQQTSMGHAAGLESFIFGKTASLRATDAYVIGLGGAACVAVSCLLFKELKLLCFDEGFAAAHGLPVRGMDLILMSLIVVVSIIGLQSVGLILMIALLVIPTAAARFWTGKMVRMSILSGIFGAISCLVGAMVSALLPRMPSGATIVLAASLAFGVSFFFGRERGAVIRWYRRLQLHARVDRQHLLRAMFELSEDADAEANLATQGRAPEIAFESVLDMRSWSARRLRRQIRAAANDGVVVSLRGNKLRLTESGEHLASRLVHQHRLWEMYLITHAEIAPSKVDRDADMIEHVLTPLMIAQLEQLVGEAQPAVALPPSPHPISVERSTHHQPKPSR